MPRYLSITKKPRCKLWPALILVAIVTSAVLVQDEATASEVSKPWQWFLTSGTVTGQLTRPDREARIANRIFDYSGMSLGGGYQAFYRDDFLLEGAVTLLVAYESKKVIAQAFQLGGAYALLGGASQRRTARGPISATSRYPHGLFVSAKLSHSDYAFASERNTFDDTTGSVIHMVVGGEWYFYVGDQLGVGGAYQRTLYSFSNSTESLSSQENRILFMLLMTH